MSKLRSRSLIDGLYVSISQKAGDDRDRQMLCYTFIPFILSSICNHRKMQINLLNEVIITAGIVDRPNVDWPWIMSLESVIWSVGKVNMISKWWPVTGVSPGHQWSAPVSTVSVMQLCPRLPRPAMDLVLERLTFYDAIVRNATY